MDTKLHGLSTSQGHSSCPCSTRLLFPTYTEIRARTLGHDHHATLRRLPLLSDHGRPLHSMARSHPSRSPRGSTVAKAFYTHWIARFGTPLRITTDQGRQFESSLFKELSTLTGSHHLRTTAYHLAANGMVERLHRQLKAAIKCHHTDRWTDILPTVLLGIRAAWRDDFKASSAELVYGEPLRLPGEFLASKADCTDSDSTTEFVKDIRNHMRQLQPVNGTQHGGENHFIFKDLHASDRVFVRRDLSKRCLQMP
ncbi:hypothetical protein M8J77_023450 [Diaphorina citri]|nr:hypothetical protein M8J77_023450 [Diaphorina citri]